MHSLAKHEKGVTTKSKCTTAVPEIKSWNVLALILLDTKNSQDVAIHFMLLLKAQYVKQ